MQPGAGAQMNMYGGTVSAGGMANGFMQQAPAMSQNMGMQQVNHDCLTTDVRHHWLFRYFCEVGYFIQLFFYSFCLM